MQTKLWRYTTAMAILELKGPAILCDWCTLLHPKALWKQWWGPAEYASWSTHWVCWEKGKLEADTIWCTVSMDIMHFGGQHYLTLIDCGPTWFVIWRFAAATGFNQCHLSFRGNFLRMRTAWRNTDRQWNCLLQGFSRILRRLQRGATEA